MLQEQFQEAIQSFQNLDSVTQKGIFLFWGLCVVAFYLTLVQIVFLIGKELISKVFRLAR